MDEDEHRRAEEEMKELHLRHLHLRNESQKFVNRLISTFYKVLVLAIALGFLCLLPSQFATFGRYFRRAVIARTWDAVNIILVGIAIAYGVLGRTRMADQDVQENDQRNRNGLYVNRFLESGEEYTEPVGRRKEFGLALDSSVDIVAENVVPPLVPDDGRKKKNAEVVCSNPREMPLEPLVEIDRFVESPPGHRMRSLRNSISYQDLREFSHAEEDSNRRRAMDDIDLDRRNRHRSQHFAPESNGFEDSAPKSIEVKDSALESNGYEDSPQIKSDGFEAVSCSGYQSSLKSEVITHADSHLSSVTAEVVEASENKHSLSIVNARTGPPQPPPLPPPPLPPPPVSVISQPEKDSNMEPPPPHYTSLKRKRKIISTPPPPPPPPRPPPPPPPPRPPPALEALPKEKTRDASGHEKSENPKKLEKTKSDKRNLFSLPPRPPPPPVPRPTEHGVTVNHESRHRKSRSEEDSKYITSNEDEYRHRSIKEDEYKNRSRKEDEYKHRSSKDEYKYKSAKDIASAFGLLDRKNKKIPSPPTPPPPPSALQQWWSSYKKDSKHKNKDSEPSPRSRSDKSSRKVHSSPSPPPAPPPPPPPPNASIIEKISKHHRKGRASTSHPPAPPPPPPPLPTSIVDKPSKHHRDGSSESNGLSKPRRDESSESNDSSNSSKENMVGDNKAIGRRKSLPIPLPPPPPPPPFPMSDHQWTLSDTKHEKKRSSPAASVESESEPEPERGWGFVFRKQFSLDNGDTQFCPSPSPDEVNRQADAFIANFHKQIRLQKLNSFHERL